MRSYHCHISLRLLAFPRLSCNEKHKTADSNLTSGEGFAPTAMAAASASPSAHSATRRLRLLLRRLLQELRLARPSPPHAPLLLHLATALRGTQTPTRGAGSATAGTAPVLGGRMSPAGSDLALTATPLAS